MTQQDWNEVYGDEYVEFLEAVAEEGQTPFHKAVSLVKATGALPFYTTIA